MRDGKVKDSWRPFVALCTRAGSIALNCGSMLTVPVSPSA